MGAVRGMSEGTVSLPWIVIRQDDNGNRYRVGRYATRAEAQKVADSFEDPGHERLYSVERVAQNGDGGRN
ncbi:SPOR domain-containing protein [Streptomyces misionensis]|uniref:SPOR domain-containing protein n=2 Tax=Streptomyces misionensis TaxID=67331 RepID=A0A5C6JVM5_9ACTN|nr:SPOR domain-containing protein [Streptomyces misionensis]